MAARRVLSPRPTPPVRAVPASYARFATWRRSRGTAAALALVVAAVLGLSVGPAAASPSASSDGSHASTDHPGSVLAVTADDSSGGNRDFYRLNTHVLRAGLVTVRLSNVGTVAHQVQLIRLHDGITAAKYLADLVKSQGGSALAEGDAAGGATAVEPGGHQVTWINLRSGSYVALCFQDGGDAGAPHFVHGMYTSFTVVGHDHQGSPEHVKGTIRAFSFGYHMPKVIDGHATYRFVNTATKDTHELQLLKLLPGKTAADVLAWVKRGEKPPSPVSGNAGGAGAIPPGGHEWLRTNLKPGHYVALCFVPDDEPPHAPHAELGMIQGFTVKD